MFLIAQRALAQVRLGTVPVEAERPADEAPERDAPPFVTVVDARQPSARVVSMGELLERQAGVHVRSRGGLGAFTSVSIRGSESTEIALLIDGVPLSQAASGLLDLSQLPVDGLERVEVYRGVPPVELGSNAVGGAINLVTRKGTRARSWRSAAGFGSFGARSLGGGYAGTRAGLRVAVSAGYRGATGDFRYYDNGGTLLDKSDDHIEQRHNNGFDQIAVDVSIGSAGRSGFRLASHIFLKRQGVPGLGSLGAETRNATLTTGRIFVEGGVARSGRRVDLRLGLHLLYERTAFANPGGERVGSYGANVSDQQAVAPGLQGRADAPLGGHQLLSALAEARLEHRRPSDLLRPTRSGAASTRLLASLALADEIRLAADRLVLAPALRVDSTLSIAEPGRPGEPGARRQADLFFSPRLSLRFSVSPRLTLKGSAGRFVRFPTLVERFGDAAFILPHPSLQAETAWGGDAGANLTLRRGAAAAELEAVGFARWVDDYIAFVPLAFAIEALNIGRTRFLGAEARLKASLGPAAVTVDYTFLDAANFTAQPGVYGKQLPERPRHELAARADLLGRPFKLFYEVQFVGEVFRDQQNNNLLPARWLHAIGASFEHAPFLLSLEVRNLADLRVVDLPLGGLIHRGQTTPYPLVDTFDYPLPGRAVYLTLALQSR